MPTIPSRLRIIGKVYQGKPGFLVTGRDLRHRVVSIWASTQEAAERLNGE